MSELWQLTAAEAGRGIAAGEITSEALVRSCLDRIAGRDADVEAWAHLDPDYAVAGARAADASPSGGPLHGVPFGVKDVIDSGELPTEYGAPAIHAGHRPDRDAACVAAMRAAGAVLMGKTVSTEFATFQPGKTRNPHNPAHTPGGSSSGSAAAVGASMVPIAFGNQTAGSLIRPAAFCGVVGLKPTHGTVDLTGILPLEPSFDTLGYMARSVDDVALFYDTVRGAAPAVPADGLDRAPRVGLCRTHHWKKADAVCRGAVERAAARFADLGADVAEIDLPDEFAAIPDSHRVILNAGLTQSLARQYADRRDRLSERLRGMIEEGLGYDEATVEAARTHTRACRAAAGDAFGDRDVLLTPSAPGEAPEGLGMTGDPIFQTTWTLLHLPCVTLPFATGPNGLPIGVQLIGSRGEDAAVLAVAKWFHGRM
ncbi:MAG: amidase [Defluviicoccus sp.]|nr:amidase [Defluviicoccus sp.]MDE0277869.1 amidase [Defluviicoccus sp.]